MEYRLKDIISFKPGFAFKTSQMGMDGINLIKIKSLKKNKILFENNNTKIKINDSLKEYLIYKNDILMALTGDPVNKGSYDTWVGRTSRYMYDDCAYLNQRICKLIPNEQIINKSYLYYWLIQYDKTYEIASLCHGSANQANISHKDVGELKIDLPNLKIQKKITNILYTIDKKIELNNQINDNLLNIIDTYFDEIFTDRECTKRADEIADITIGKTPPRAKAECFTKKDNDIKWLSISDIGRCGIYVFDTSEKLTLDAVNKYNVKIIPENTIVLSFKLTVGRVAITNEKMATNEAIAHFNLYDDRLRSYIYTYLRKFDYDKLGSTSSIATAVNSKIIKAMPIKVPDDGKIEKFNKLADEILKIIRINERENRRLGQLRDTLLPKLMNGELNLDKIEM
jgi:type I restriction enzyme S subunit